jgi:hypothetical protein
MRGAIFEMIVGEGSRFDGLLALGFARGRKRWVRVSRFLALPQLVVFERKDPSCSLEIVPK